MYNIQNIVYLVKLCLQLPPQERINLQMRTFKGIWEDLWVQVDSGSRNFKHANEKFSTIRSQKKYGLNNLIRQVPCTWGEAEWGFPKGRLEKNESELQCALRELFEETNIPESSIVQIYPKTISETIVGTNNLTYQNEYYLAIVKSTCEPFLNAENRSQFQEIGDLGWFNFQDALRKCRSYEEEKKETLKKIH